VGCVRHGFLVIYRQMKWRADSRGIHFLDFSLLRLEMPAVATGNFCQIEL
jgi:hypothetical protein